MTPFTMNTTKIFNPVELSTLLSRRLMCILPYHTTEFQGRFEISSTCYGKEVFKDNVSLYNPGCPRTPYVDKVFLKLIETLLPLPPDAEIARIYINSSDSD